MTVDQADTVIDLLRIIACCSAALVGFAIGKVIGDILWPPKPPSYSVEIVTPERVREYK